MKIVRSLVQLVLSAALAFAALLVCLVLLDTPGVDTFSDEHVKRVRYPNMMHIWRDEDFSRYYSNSFGLLGPDPLPASDSNVFRIALFGDSFVEALQVPEEKHFATLLQKLLTEKRLSDKKIEVWNFGFSGDNTGNAFARWKYRPRGYAFDLAIFSFNDGDLVENTLHDAPAGDGAFLVRLNNGDFALDESRIGPRTSDTDIRLKREFGRLFYTIYRIKNRTHDWVEERQAKMRTMFSSASAADSSRAVSNVAPLHRGRDATSLAVDTADQLKYVRASFVQEGIPTLLVGIPTPRIAVEDYVDEDKLRRAAYIEVAQRLKASAEPFVDLLPPVEADQKKGVELYTDWDNGGHFNRVGHQLIAAQLADGVLRLTGHTEGTR